MYVNKNIVYNLIFIYFCKFSKIIFTPVIYIHRARPGSGQSRDPGRDLAILSRPGPGRDGLFGRDFSRNFRCITSEKFTPTMLKVCPNYALCPNYARVCPKYAQCFASTIPQLLCINIGPSFHIILSCIENHKFIINTTNGYEKHKNIKQCEMTTNQ